MVCLTADQLAASADRALKAHAIGVTPSAPAMPEDPDKAEAAKPKVVLWNKFQEKAIEKPMEIENRFYPGFDHDVLDWSKPVHGILVDFKADGMQMGMLIQRLLARNEQYVFIGSPLPFNDSWHFSAVDDFEAPIAQKDLDPAWRGIRIWHRVNYVPATTPDGDILLVPRAISNEGNSTDGAIVIGAEHRLTSIFLVGGLMAGTLIANKVKPGTPMNALLEKHIELGVTIAAIGHGLGVAIAAGSSEKSAIEGYEVGHGGDKSCMHMIEVNKLIDKGHLQKIGCHIHPSGTKLVFASVWGKETCDEFFNLSGLERPSSSCPVDEAKKMVRNSTEVTFELDMGQIMQEKEFAPTYNAGPGRPLIAILVDDGFDPVEAFTVVAKCMEAKVSFQFVSHSAERVGEHTRDIASETVFGNSMYNLVNCCLRVPTICADRVGETAFTAFAVAGGMGPFSLVHDSGVKSLLNRISLGGAVCHGPMALIGTKWLAPASNFEFTSFNGCWMYFRDCGDRRKTLRPGEGIFNKEDKLFTGNSPVGAALWVHHLFEAILA